MKRILLAALALAACAPPTGGSAPSASPDPLAVRYEVRVGQSVLPNVRSVAVSGPDLELIEARPAGAPTTLLPGRFGPIKLAIRTDWASGERTMETWRASITNPNPDLPIAPTRQNIAIAVTTPAGAPPATYTFTRCLPTEHQMELDGQDARIGQLWRVTCEGVQRS